MGFDQPDMQLRRHLLDAEDKAIENRVAQFGGKADIQRAGGDGRVEVVDFALIDGRPEIQHVADLGAQLQRARRWREAVRHADEKRIVEDLAQTTQRMRDRRCGHMHLFRHVCGISLAQQLGENHQQLGIHVHHDQARLLCARLDGPTTFTGCTSEFNGFFRV
ncbi:hypothetical protein D3C87_1260560 [compost metagenome]